MPGSESSGSSFALAGGSESHPRRAWRSRSTVLCPDDVEKVRKGFRMGRLLDCSGCQSFRFQRSGLLRFKHRQGDFELTQWRGYLETGDGIVDAVAQPTGKFNPDGDSVRLGGTALHA